MSTQDDINRLVRRERPEQRLGAAGTPPAIRPKIGLYGRTPSGIQPPLTETNADDREYYEPVAPTPPPHKITSTDGIFVIEYFPIKSMSFTDGDGNALPFEFDEPTPV